MSFRCCAVVPVFNQPEQLERVLTGLLAQDLTCLLVDDGSEADTAAIMDRLAARQGVELIRHEQNQGKGVAVITGLRHAARKGFTHALQVDADGQHNLDDVPALLDRARAEPEALVSGRPVYDETVPRGRVLARYVTHVWVWIETLSLDIADSMCGYRVYPVAASLTVAASEGVGARMDFDTEIMVRLYWRGVPVRFLPTRVRYDTGAASRFRPVRDNLRISWMHTRLVFGMLRRLPRLLGRRIARLRHWSRIGERGTVLGLRLTVLSYRLLGRAGMSALMWPVSLYYLLFHPTARSASMNYFARLKRQVPDAPKPGWLTSQRHFRQFARSHVDRVAAWSGRTRSLQVEFDNRATVEAMLARPGGCLLLGAHVGNLEAARALVQQYPDVRINALVHTANARKYNRIMRELNPQFEDRLIVVESLGADTAALLQSRMEAGEHVVIVGDRTPAVADSPRTTAPFLGEPAPFPVGPYVLAHALACPVYLLFCMERAPGRYRLYLESFAESLRLPRRDRETAIRHHAGRYARRLEEMVREYPYQWYNFYDFWKHDDLRRERRRATRDQEIVE